MEQIPSCFYGNPVIFARIQCDNEFTGGAVGGKRFDDLSRNVVCNFNLKLVVNVSMICPVTLSVISICASTGLREIASIVTPLKTVSDFFFTSTVLSIL